MKLKYFLPIAFAAALAAQTAPQRPVERNAGALKNYLGLTDQQATDLKQLRQSSVQSLKPMLQDVRTKAVALRELVNGANPDPAEVGRATLAVKAARGQASAAVDRYRDTALGKLTSDQRSKLDELAKMRSMLPAARQARALGLLPGAGFGGRFMGRRPAGIRPGPQAAQ